MDAIELFTLKKNKYIKLIIFKQNYFLSTRELENIYFASKKKICIF